MILFEKLEALYTFLLCWRIAWMCWWNGIHRSYSRAERRFTGMHMLMQWNRWGTSLTNLWRRWNSMSDSDPEETNEQHSLLSAVWDFSVISFLYFSADILQQVSSAQKYMQTPDITLNTIATKKSSCSIIVDNDDVLQALAKCNELDILLISRSEEINARRGAKRCQSVIATGD